MVAREKIDDFSTIIKTEVKTEEMSYEQIQNILNNDGYFISYNFNDLCHNYHQHKNDFHLNTQKYDFGISYDKQGNNSHYSVAEFRKDVSREFSLPTNKRELIFFIEIYKLLALKKNQNIDLENLTLMEEIVKYKTQADNFVIEEIVNIKEEKLFYKKNYLLNKDFIEAQSKVDSLIKELKNNVLNKKDLNESYEIYNQEFENISSKNTRAKSL